MWLSSSRIKKTYIFIYIYIHTFILKLTTEKQQTHPKYSLYRRHPSYLQSVSEWKRIKVSQLSCRCVSWNSMRVNEVGEEIHSKDPPIRQVSSCPPALCCLTSSPFKSSQISCFSRLVLIGVDLFFLLISFNHCRVFPVCKNGEFEV